MAILYAMISRSGDKTMLTQYSVSYGGFTDAVQVVLSRINVELNPKMSIQSGEHTFHYITHGNFIALCITSESYDRVKAFSFLETIKNQFGSLFNPEQILAANMFEFDHEFCEVFEKEMKMANEKSNGNNSENKVERLREEVQHVKDIMVSNIDSIVERGERLDLLVDKAESLSSESVSFRQSTSVLRRRMWWENTKLKIIVGLIIGFIIFYAIVSASCGGLSWPKCV